MKQFKFLPTILSLIITIPVFVSILIFNWDRPNNILLVILFLEISAFLLLWFLSILFFPRIVVAILKDKNARNPDKLILWTGGKNIYSQKHRISLPFQFSFQVWRKDIYDLYLDTGEGKPLTKSANTFENRVCHIEFSVNKDD